MHAGAESNDYEIRGFNSYFTNKMGTKSKKPNKLLIKRKALKHVHFYHADHISQSQKQN